MDDRRRTISSEEQMIGEALMRVSNTLEAQRLTKSLDYQEHIRRNAKVRLVVAILCLVAALGMVAVGGALLFVLWKYADPVLATLMPFLKGVFGDFGIIWDGLVESATYMPVMVEQLTRILESMCVLLEGVSSIDIAGLMKYLSSMLGTMSGLLAGLPDMLGSLPGVLSKVMETLKPLLSVLMGALTNILGMIGQADFSGLMGSMDLFLKNMGSMTTTLAEAMANPALPASLIHMMEAMATTTEGLSTLMAVAGDTIQNIDPDQINGMIQGMTNFMTNMGLAMGEVGEAIANTDIEAMMTNMMNAMVQMSEAMVDMTAVMSDLINAIGGILP